MADLVEPASGAAPKLAGRRVLVVEDEALVAMLIETMLEDLGCAIVGPATRLEDGLSLVSEGGFDLALLDVNLAGQQAFPIAEALEQAGVPFAFSTGYGEGGLPERWRNRPTLQKPYDFDDVIETLGQLVAA